MLHLHPDRTLSTEASRDQSLGRYWQSLYVSITTVWLSVGGMAVAPALAAPAPEAAAAGAAAPETAAPEAAQRPRPVRAPAGEADFWFGRPTGSVSFRGTWFRAREQARDETDLFGFLQDEFTIEPGDFSAPGFGVDVAATVSSQVDFVLGIDFNRKTQVSEYRDFVDNDRLPIVQDTSLTTANLTGSVKFSLTPKGRQVGRLAWIPATAVPYVGGGGGLLWYKLEQQGDFVDFLDFSVFESRFESTAWTPSAHLFAGVDIRMWKRLFLNLEGRYLWADAELRGDYTGFEPIDLSGFKVLTGVSVAF